MVLCLRVKSRILDQALDEDPNVVSEHSRRSVKTPETCAVRKNSYGNLPSKTPGRIGIILWMEEILHQLVTIGKYKTLQIVRILWDKHG